jgi:energy-coupling factor transporter ATP-binding protein EcfA2
MFLERLHAFVGFKKLSQSLAVDFPTQLTVVFGKNASGKSSLCDALKILASAERPQKPIKNVRSHAQGEASFSYKFRASHAPRTWTEGMAFGAEAHALKYFDSSIAIRHVTEALHPREVVEVAVFRLEVFDFARKIVTALQAHAQRVVSEQTQKLQSEIDEARTRLAETQDVSQPPFSTLSPTNASLLAQALDSLPPYGDKERADAEVLARRQSQLAAASSDEGLRSLKAQASLLGHVVTQLEGLQSIAGPPAHLRDLQTMSALAAQKRAASQELNHLVFSGQSNPEALHSLIAAAGDLRDFSSATLDTLGCPLCRQPLSAQASALFRAFGQYLTSALQAEVRGLDERIQAGSQAIQRLSAFRLPDFSAAKELLPSGTLDAVVDTVTAVVGSTPGVGGSLADGKPEEYERVRELDAHLKTVRLAKSRLDETIATSTQNRGKILQEFANAEQQMRRLAAHESLDRQRQSLRRLCDAISAFAPVQQCVQQTDFTSLLRSMTNKGKEAHKELVLAEFERRLDAEYRALCGAGSSEMGVKLKPSGEQQDVIVTPQVGNTQVVRVLSEGEQKVHALAVFLCEAAAHPSRVLVFDDPVTSFDYNYISNFCERLRNIVRDQPGTQVIVLTHNWDFFANLQTTLNRSGLGSRMTVSVLENCETLKSYREDFAALLSEIAPHLAGPAEPSDAAKSELAALMRRLIEVVVNQFAFAGERHQYKQKTQQISDFPKFTRLVALRPTEANKLRDIYANLSPPEHDDLRNFYTSRGRLQFKTWFDEIIVIKDALEARRPQ